MTAGELVTWQDVTYRVQTVGEPEPSCAGSAIVMVTATRVADDRDVFFYLPAEMAK